MQQPEKGPSGQNREKLEFHQACRILQADHSLWGKVRGSRGEVEVKVFSNGAKFIADSDGEIRKFYVEGEAADCQMVKEMIRRGEVAELLRSKMN